ncbi:MAG: histidine phosphatase family protein [Ruminococcaceae bacterium]|nr:histidine phosphatase family protein [Oscillospiraceae bacterium]
MYQTIYFLRHGEAESNVGGFFGGQCDVPLTEKGRMQAAATAPLFADVKLDKVYCSTLSRAMDTAALALPGYTPEYSDEICEMNVGEAVLKTPAQCAALWGEEFTKNRAVGNFVPFGGENLDMLEARMGKFLERVLPEHEDGSICIVSHGGAISAATRYLLGRHPIGGMENCGVSVLVRTGDKWIIKKWNATYRL